MFFLHIFLLCVLFGLIKFHSFLFSLYWIDAKNVVLFVMNPIKNKEKLFSPFHEATKRNRFKYKNRQLFITHTAAIPSVCLLSLGNDSFRVKSKKEEKQLLESDTNIQKYTAYNSDATVLKASCTAQRANQMHEHPNNLFVIPVKSSETQTRFTLVFP